MSSSIARSALSEIRQLLPSSKPQSLSLSLSSTKDPGELLLTVSAGRTGTRAQISALAPYILQRIESPFVQAAVYHVFFSSFFLEYVEAGISSFIEEAVTQQNYKFSCRLPCISPQGATTRNPIEPSCP